MSHWALAFRLKQTGDDKGSQWTRIHMIDWDDGIWDYVHNINLYSWGGFLVLMYGIPRKGTL